MIIDFILNIVLNLSIMIDYSNIDLMSTVNQQFITFRDENSLVRDSLKFYFIILFYRPWILVCPGR